MMKTLHQKALSLFVLGMFSAFLSYAQNPVITSNASNPSSCDGWAYLADSSINVSTITWWENGNVIATGTSYIDSICPGTYTITYTDPTNGTYTFDITGNGNPCQSYYATANSTNISATGLCDGSTTISTYNGTAPYTFSWNTGATTSSLNNLCPGTYSYTVVDANGCSTSGYASVSAPPQYDSIVTISTGNASGPNTCDGWAYITDSIDFSTVTWWENGNIIATGVAYVNNLCPGSYTITYTNPVNGSYTFDITGNGNPCQYYYASTSETDISAAGACDGTAGVAAYNGTAPFTYSWSNGSTTASLSNLCAGTYSYTVVDANGCSASGAVTVYESGQFDSILIINNNNYSNQPVTGTYTAPYLDCNIDYNAIGGASITSAVNLNGPNMFGIDTIAVTWTVVDTNNNVMATYDIDYIVSDSSYGVIEFGLLLYCYQKSLGYTSMMATDRVLFETLSIQEEQLNNFAVVNPMNDQLTIYFNEETKGSVEVVSNTGAIVKHGIIEGKTLVMPVTELQQGVYFVHIVANNKSATVKVVK